MKWLLKVFILLGVPCVPEHGIRAFMKSHFQFFSRSGTGVAETLKGFLVIDFFVYLSPMGAVPLHPEQRFHWEIVFVSPKTVSVSPKIVSVCSRNTYFGKSKGIMLQ